MARPLRKTKLDGSPYRRRPHIEAEIEELTAISSTELERRASLWPRAVPGFISPEALVYLVRNATPGTHRDKLTEQLVRRVFLLAPRAADSDGLTVSLTRTNIRDDLVDHFIDILLSDRDTYDGRLDYYEISFYSAVAKDRKDASYRHWKREKRSAELGTEEIEVSDVVEAAIGGYDPFDPNEMDKKVYRRLLDDAIDSLPVFQRRIVEMVRQEIPIESKDPSVNSISKALSKTEKTIRTHRDKAYASLRLRLERKGTL